VSSVAYLGIGTSSWVDLALVAGEVAVIAALAISVLVKIGPALGEEARNPRRSIPASTIGIVIVTGVFYLLVVCAETFGAGRHDILAFPPFPPPYPGRGHRLCRRAHAYARAAVDLYLRRARIRISRRGRRAFGGAHLPRRERLGHPCIPYRVPRRFPVLPPSVHTGDGHCFPVVSLWGILYPRGRTLMDLLPFAALGWLCLGVIAASALRTRRLAESPAQG
jgi:hypothetical protein